MIRRSLFICVLSALAFTAAVPAAAQQPPAITVDGRVALASLQSLCDAHLRAVLDGLQTLAATREAQSASWPQIEVPLRAYSAGLHLPAVVWFARPDGSYWTVQSGRQTANLADRPYFATLRRGQPVVGELVASRSTGKPVAVVAVPVRNANGTMIGVLGTSVHLDALSGMLQKELDLGPNALIFSLDPHGVVGISVNRAFQMRHFASISPELHAAFTHMLATDHGTVTYTLHGVPRTVIYRTSPFTGWRYAFGLIGAPAK
jgi:hypothetical protein